MKTILVGSGLYYVTFGDDLSDLYYLTVDHENSRRLTTTTKLEDAEMFMIKMFPAYGSHHQFEFSLTSTFPKFRERLRKGGLRENYPREFLQESDHEWREANFLTSTSFRGSSGSEYLKILPLEYYLETNVNPLGKGRLTPSMRINSKSKHTRLLLKDRTNHKIASDTKHWLKGREAYYIQCIHRLHSGYLCAKKITHSERYKVCIKPSVDSHSDNGQVFMIFRLKPDLKA